MLVGNSENGGDTGDYEVAHGPEFWEWEEGRWNTWETHACDKRLCVALKSHPILSLGLGHDGDENRSASFLSTSHLVPWRDPSLIKKRTVPSTVFVILASVSVSRQSRTGWMMFPSCPSA
ncbi:unnamed protein product [Cylicocyclus nassatus]|uniref:Uncharacterized protein n=1 Tax=Cylicocyclus nassatus TaxID=53992 RepID=A0AA36H8G7_CYLNA|nr:unnamed protein product [Cylicocyclus nassatus]